ncbi:cytoskeleton protein RodZ [Arboricoccus pini]|uniref:Cytoskeleton protein RodZ n=1 Tax=Arboricoccus pini TaxID=1963835 RepID=A0A212QZY1_9PROT|nr:helix-turn-helix domain-containing protein [Arboricoccus pini]SNB65308.1 cytoskeleton protein RodZ [Arboricoccus pini]
MSQRIPEQRSMMDDKSLQLIVSLGEALREARQNRGEDLYDVASYLRIKPSYLYALEEGDISLTPGRAYALGFIRSYADYLGFDGGDVVRQVKQAVDRSEVSPPLRYRTPISGETARPSGFLLGLSIVLIGLIYGTWHIYFRGEPMLDRVTSVPGELGRMTAELLNTSAPTEQPKSSLAPAAAVTSMARSPEESITPSQSIQIAKAPGATLPAEQPQSDRLPASADALGNRTTASVQPSSPSHGDTSSPVTTADLLQALKASGPLPNQTNTTGTGEASSLPDHSPASDPMEAAAADAPRVILVARENSWIQIKSADRDFVRTTTLTPGQRIELPNRTDLALWTGNAGGLEVVVDGQNLGVLGQSGRVVRDVALSPSQLKSRQSSIQH